MDVMLVLWVAWGVVASVLLVVLGYRGTLTRYEEDQIFLNDTGGIEVQEQSEIQRKLEKVRPFLVTSVWTISALSVIILGMYVRAAIQNLM